MVTRAALSTFCGRCLAQPCEEGYAASLPSWCPTKNGAEMADHSVETSPQIYARIGGWLYLIIIVAGISAELFVRDRLIVSGDATAQPIILWPPGCCSESALLSSKYGLGVLSL